MFTHIIMRIFILFLFLFCLYSFKSIPHPIAESWYSPLKYDTTVLVYVNMKQNTYAERLAIRIALDSIESRTGKDFKAVYDNEPETEHVTICFTSSRKGFNGINSLAETMLCYNDNCSFKIIFDRTLQITSQRRHTTLIHEIGHCFGAPHHNEGIMSTFGLMHSQKMSNEDWAVIQKYIYQ